MSKKSLTILFVTIFIDYLSFGIVFPLIPYYIEHFGGNAFTVGLLAASFSIMQFLCAPVWGRLSDKVGRKPIILISLLGTAISLFGFGLSKSIITLFITRIIAGLFTSASLPATYAYVADNTSDKERAAKFGVLGAAWGIGNTFGPALGGIFSRVSITAPFFIAALIALLNFFVAYFFLPSSKIKENIIIIKKESLFNFAKIIKHLKSNVGLLFLLFFTASFALSILEIIFPLLTQLRFHFNETNIGFFFTFIGIVIALTQGILVGKSVKRFGEVKTIIIAHLLMITGYICISSSFNLPALLFSSGILAVGIALNEPCLVALISKKSGEGEGVTLGTTWGFDSLARVIGPAIGGFVYLRITPTAPFYLNALFLVVSLIVIRAYKIKVKTYHE